MAKIIRITTVSLSLHKLLHGQLGFINKYFEVVAVSSPGVFMNDVINNEGIRVYPIRMTRTINPVSDIISLFKLIRFLLKEKPEIVHSHTPKAGIIGMLAAWFCRVPVRMHTVAGLPLFETSGFKKGLLKFVEKTTYACATHVYPNSFGLKEIIIKNKFCSLTKLSVIANGSSNGIDTNYFSREAVDIEQAEQLRKKYFISKDDFVFIFIGRIVKDKGINELVFAFEKLSKEFNKIKLLMVGPEETLLDPLNEGTLQIMQNHPGIICAGFQEDVRPFLTISDVLVFPSYREGFPNVPMQAGAMGLPSIVTDINGCNEIINGKNGIIIPPKDEQALYDAMKSVLENKEQINEMANSARSMIVSRYEQKFLWDALLKTYNDNIDKLNNKNQTH